MRLTRSQRKMLGMTKFFLIFSLAALPVYLINLFNINLYPLELIEAVTVSAVLRLFSVPHELTQTISYETGHNIPLIIAGNELLGIGRSCTAYIPMLAFLGLVLGSPKKNKKKSLIYLPIIYSFNLARLFFISLASVTNPALVPFLHTFLWREGLIATIFISWAIWFKS